MTHDCGDMLFVKWPSHSICRLRFRLKVEIAYRFGKNQLRRVIRFLPRSSPFIN